jgi:hypothetical protein
MSANPIAHGRCLASESQPTKSTCGCGFVASARSASACAAALKDHRQAAGRNRTAVHE